MNVYESRLRTLAFKKATPFCYSCYKSAPSARCEVCQSDDLMLLLEGVGVEYGPDWVYKHLLEEALTPADTDTAFEESVRQCYPDEVSIGWITVDTVSAIQELDPVSWDLALGEWIDCEITDGNLLTFDNGSTYFWSHDVERFLDETESKTDTKS